MSGKRGTKFERVKERTQADLTPLSIAELVDLYCSASIHVAAYYRGKDRPYRCFSIPIVINGKRTVLRQAKTKGILAQLGLTKPDTKIFKQKLTDRILSLSHQEMFGALTYMLDKHRTLSMHMSPASVSPTFTISDKSGLLRQMFDRLGFTYQERRNGYVLRIVQGSFYINGEWLHIG